jgi:hypothetical protein
VLLIVNTVLPSIAINGKWRLIVELDSIITGQAQFSEPCVGPYLTWPFQYTLCLQGFHNAKATLRGIFTLHSKVDSGANR